MQRCMHCVRHDSAVICSCPASWNWEKGSVRIFCTPYTLEYLVVAVVTLWFHLEERGAKEVIHSLRVLVFDLEVSRCTCGPFNPCKRSHLVTACSCLWSSDSWTFQPMIIFPALYVARLLQSVPFFDCQIFHHLLFSTSMILGSIRLFLCLTRESFSVPLLLKNRCL